MDKRIFSVILFIVVGFTVAESSEAVINQSGISNVIAGYFDGDQPNNDINQTAEGINSSGESVQIIEPLNDQPPNPPPPIP